MQTIKQFNNEITESLKHWRIWLLLAWQDIQLRYRRSSLGPLWITISMAVTIYSMGFLYSHLFRAELERYFPFLAAGIITWALISNVLNESCNTFVESENYIRNLQLPYSVFVIRAVLRNLIIFAHNLIAIVPVYFMFSIDPGIKILLLIPGLCLVLINATVYGAILAYLGTRYRDLSQIVVSLVQVCFFLTPIMWMPNLLSSKYHFLLNFNPFYHFVNLVRSPLIGQSFTRYDLIVPVLVTCMGLLILAKLYRFSKNKLVFWL